MANVSVATYVKGGLTPLRKLGSRPNSGGFGAYPIANGQTGSIFKGDPVRIGGGTVSVCPDGGTPDGVFLGCKYATQAQGTVHSSYFPSGTSMGAPDGRVDGYNQPLAYVLDDPDQTYAILIKSSAGTTFQAGDYATVSNGGGNTQNGQSTGHAFTSANVTAGVAMFRVLGTVQYPGWGENQEDAIEVIFNPNLTSNH